MHFLSDVWVPCERCGGRRFDAPTLGILFKGKSVGDVLEMDVDEAMELFESHPKIAAILETLRRVGLGYVKLGQSADTLSGGEAQRVKLASELLVREGGGTLYVLDEPTTGLHFEDVRRLLAVLQALVDGGNTVVVIEHQLDVIRSADWVVDLGPEAGDDGGRIVAQGTPEAVARVSASHTGRCLAGR
jgi:excinuclease ABC subunit A